MLEHSICPLCKRSIERPKDGNKHHLKPKSRGGKPEDIVVLHRICHQKIHTIFTEKELEQKYFTIEALLKTEQIKKFVKWVKNKPSDFYDGNKTTSRLKDKRRERKRR